MKKTLLFLILGIGQLLFSQTNFQITPPKGWKSFTKSDIVKNIDKIYSIPESKKEEIVKNNTSVEIVRFMTNSIDGTYSPNLQVLLRPNTTKNLSELKKAVEISLESFKKVIGDFKITQPISQIKIDGKDALTLKTEGYFKIQNNEKNYFRTIIIVIPNGNTFYQITLNDTKYDSYEKEFKEVINSIKL